MLFDFFMKSIIMNATDVCTVAELKDRNAVLIVLASRRGWSA